MSDFVWIVPSERLSSLGNNGISSSYIIPQGQMNGQESRLCGKRLWIVLRGTEDRCVAVASIKGVERFREGYHENDFLVSCDTTASFRISTSFENARPYALHDFRDQGLGMHDAPEKAVNRLKGAVSKTVQVKLAAPADATLKRANFDALPKGGERLAKAALSQITQALPLDQVWASGTGDKFGPFSNFASQLLFLNGFDARQVSPFLKVNDPVSLLTEATGNAASSKLEFSGRAVEKGVDLDFTKIDPENIYAREFILSEGFLPDLASALSKTEAAEKLHQDMLRDISAYLKENGISPYESASIDLMITLNGQTRIFEIKSSTPANIVAQSAKGAFQMACYVNAMAADYEPLDAALILHKIEDTNLEKFVHDALTRLNVKHLTYNPRAKWPERVAGLFN
jgi:hypothetical protein